MFSLKSGLGRIAFRLLVICFSAGFSMHCQRIFVKQPEKVEKMPEWPEIRLIFAGDTHFMWGVADLQEKQDLIYPVEELLPFFKEADFRAVNLETAISEQGSPQQRKAHVFRADPGSLHLLQALRVDLAILANNHAMDLGTTGLNHTMKNLRQAGLSETGAGLNAVHAVSPYFFMRKGVKFAVLGFNAIGEGLAFSAGVKPGVAALGPEVLDAIKQARTLVDHVIVSLHWGREYYTRPGPEQIAQARKMIDNGASIVIGHHPHIPQGLERYHSGFIFYSLGNFLFGSVNQQQEHNLIARINILPETKKISSINLFAVSGRYRESGQRLKLLTHRQARSFWSEYFLQCQDLDPGIKNHFQPVPSGVLINVAGLKADP